MRKTDISLFALVFFITRASFNLIKTPNLFWILSLFLINIIMILILGKTNLNINFLKHFAENWQNMISLHKWQISNISWVQGESINTKTAYDYELGEFKEGIIDEKKIGLMYISDVYYSVPSEFWSYPGYIGPAEGDIEVHRDYRIGTW